MKSLAKKGLLLWVSLLFLSLSTCSTTSNNTPTSVVLFISDGTGLSHLTALRYTTKNFALERMPIVGLFTTHSADHRVTDSAAGATAFATGYKTNNGMLSVLPDSTTKPETLLEIAEEMGKSTGLVATSQITHATPAAFAAHVISRNMEMEIARQEKTQNIEALLGGGQLFFRDNDSGDNLVQQMVTDGYTYVDSREGLENIDAAHTDKILGLFAPRGMKPASEGRMPLSLMTQKAVEVLDQNPKGFFLMVEASQVDWEAHDNDANGIIAETHDMNGAMQWLIDYQESHPELLLVWVADHETGGFSILGDLPTGDSLETAFTTNHHTAQMIPLFAIGPEAENFQGVYDNTDVGQRLITLMRNSQ